MKRILILTLATLFAAFAPYVSALEYDNDPNGTFSINDIHQEYVINVSGLNTSAFDGQARSAELIQRIAIDKDSSPVTITKIEELMDERRLALLDEDFDLFEQITATLRSLGVEEVSLSQVEALTGESFSKMGITPASSQNVLIETTYSTIVIWSPALGGGMIVVSCV
ncbi:MAG: hypothetical protein FWG31_02565 [Oscillospiraceae bacterium]|nr:hypothetical protein [Oscillospiraceae bacterium]